MAYRDNDNFTSVYDFIINQLFIYDYSDELDFEILKSKVWSLDGPISVADSATVVEDDISAPKNHFESLLNELTFLDAYIKTQEGTLAENERNFTELKARRVTLMTAWVAKGNNSFDMRYSTRPTLLTDAQFTSLYTSFVTKRTAGELSIAEDIVTSVTTYCIDTEIFQAESTTLNYIQPSVAEESMTQLASAGIDNYDNIYVTQMNESYDELGKIVRTIAPSAAGTLLVVNLPHRREQISTIQDHSSHKGLISLGNGYTFTYMVSAGEESSVVDTDVDTNNMSLDNYGDPEWTFDDFEYGDYWDDEGTMTLDPTGVDIDDLPAGDSIPGSKTRERFDKLDDRWKNINRIREDKVSNIGTRGILETMIDITIPSIESDHDDHLEDRINQKQYTTEILVEKCAEYT